MAENLLDIVTGVERPTFTVDGTVCELRHPTELSMAELRRMSELGKKLQQLGEIENPDADTVLDRIERASDELLKLIAPDLPDMIRKRLTVFHILEIMQAFMGLVPTGDSQGEQSTQAS